VGDLATLVRQALDDVAASTTLAALDEVRVRWLGKKGLFTEQLKALGALPAAERPAAGARINEAKQTLQVAIDAAAEQLSAAAIEAELAAGRIDVSLPGRGESRRGAPRDAGAAAHREHLPQFGFRGRFGSRDRRRLP